MLKILKNLKKSWLSVVFIVVLLCLQAWTDLTLPDYTSKIVNTGIQAGGIEYVAPEVIRKSQMDNLLIFTDKDEEILSNYTLISKNNLSQEEYNKLQKDYPELENQDLYKLNKLNKEQKMIFPLYIRNKTTNSQSTAGKLLILTVILKILI